MALVEVESETKRSFPISVICWAELSTAKLYFEEGIERFLANHIANHHSASIFFVWVFIMAVRATWFHI